MFTFAWLTLTIGFALLSRGAHSISGYCSSLKSFVLTLDRNPHFGSFYLLSWLCSFHLSWLTPLTVAVVVSVSLWKVLPSSVIRCCYLWGSFWTWPQSLSPRVPHLSFAVRTFSHSFLCAYKLYSSDNSQPFAPEPQYWGPQPRLTACLRGSPGDAVMVF